MKKSRKLQLIIMTILFIAIMITSVLAPYIFKDVNTIDFDKAFMKPSFENLFGTDNFGRDMLIRVIYGLRTSIFIALLIEVISFSVGVIIGIIAGYYGGIIDEFVQLVISVFWSFPRMIMALSFFSIFGQGLHVLVIVISLTHWIMYAKLIRTHVLSIKASDYVIATKGLGASNHYIMFKHVLINAITPLIPMTTIMVGHTVMMVSGLAFLGFGVSPPTPEIGIMLKESLVYIEKAPWLVIFPGLALFLCTLFFNIYGDVVRDYIDPKTNVNVNSL